MVYHDCFYYTTKSNDLIYTSTPNGNSLDVGRLIKSKPCWKKNASLAQKKPKTLILNDWSALSWSDTKTEIMKKRLDALLENGFEVYAQIEWNRLRKIQKSCVLDNNQIRNYWHSHFTPVEQIIKFAISTGKFEYDQLHVIDDYWSEYLYLGAKLPKNRVLNLANVMRYPKDKREVLLEELSKANPQFDLIQPDALSEKSKATLQRIRDFFPDATLGEYSEFTLEDLYQVESELLTPSIEKLKIDARNSPKLLDKVVKENLFSKLPNIRKLEIRTNNKYLKLPDLQNISTLFLYGCTLSTDVLQTISQDHKLKVLSFKHIKFKGSMPEELHFPNLIELNLIKTKISIKMLNSIIAGSPQLKKLKLDGVSTTMDELEEDFEPFSHTGIEDLELLSKEFSVNEMKKLFESIPNLKKLVTCDFSLAEDEDFSIELTFPHLEELVLEEDPNSWQDPRYALMILKNAPRLKILQVEEGMEAELVPDNVVFQELHTLILFFSENEGARMDFINKLIQSAPSLKILDMTQLEYKIRHEHFNRHVPSMLYRERDVYYSEKYCREGRRRYTDFTHSILKFHEAEKQSNPVHNSSDFLTFKPKLENTPFIFKNKNRTLNQDMIIAKLCQYMTLKAQHTDKIGQLQNGICRGLSIFFLRNVNQYQNILNQISKWDGCIKTLDDSLSLHLNSLLTDVLKFQLKQSAPYYVGDNLDELLANHQRYLLLANPWHCIAVTAVFNGNMRLIYDPNYVNGPIKCNLNQVPEIVKKSLGPLVSSVAQVKIQASILNPSEFIREGGLFSLGCMNGNEVRNLLPNPSDIENSALKGILLRDTYGQPAWKALADYKHGKDYAEKLLQRYQDSDLKEAQTNILKSAGALSKKEQKSLAKTLANEPEEFLYYKKQFKTWKKNTPSAAGPELYLNNLFNYGYKNQLIELTSPSHVLSLAYSLQFYCQTIGREIFYIHHPEELISSAPFMQRSGNTAFLTEGPGGALYDFLNKTHYTKNPPILVVNYDAFEADDIVSFNALLDENPKAEAIPLPKDMQVIGLINPAKPGAYQGEDFYSRFAHTETCPITEEALRKTFPTPDVSSEVDPEMLYFCIDLFHAGDWEERLCGRWVVNKDNLYFQEGLLAEGLKSGLPIKILNGNWHDLKFNHFWQQARVNKHFDFGGNSVPIPENFQLIRSEGYQWEQLLSVLLFDRNLKQGAEVLNPGLLNTFFTRYCCDNSSRTLETLNGLIEDHAGLTLNVNLTRDLSEHEWAMLLTACNRHQVKLHIHAHPGIEPNPCLRLRFEPSKPEHQAWNKHENRNNPLIIQSSDIDSTCAIMTRDDSDWLVIDVSECEASDLLIHMNARLNHQEMRLEFHQEERFLLTALKNKQKVILKGHFNPSLIDALMPIVLTRPESLTLITENAECFSDFYLHQVAQNEKRRCLQSRFTDEELLLIENWSDPLCKLEAGLYHLRKHPDEKMEDAWAGMLSLPVKIKTAPFDPEKSVEKTSTFIEDRIRAVMAVLEYAPYVFLTGLTAVGKTCFVENELPASGSIIYHGEEQIEAWAKDNKQLLKILFIDEANIGNQQWSQFEGLFNINPGILHKGHWFPLNESHKVIFAGNPLSYGGERKLSSFFIRHGNALIFHPLNEEFIYERILKPVFENTLLAQHSAAIAAEILNAYRFLCKCSKDEVLISPRELQMMALMILATYEKNPSEDSLLIVNEFVRLIAKPLVPEFKIASFEAKFPPKTHLIRDAQLKVNSFYITKSRLPVVQLIHDLLKLRDRRRQLPGNDVQKYGGLGGIVLEGSPGIGKSEMVRLLLSEWKDCHYYEVPVSMPPDQKKQIIMKAFNEGAIIVMDEINSSPMMERLLNNLLMGRGPNGKRPEKPGFFIIGTQNPVKLAGRRKLGTALERRLITLKEDMLPEYTKDEMEEILRHKKIAHEKAILLTRAYLTQKEHAKINKLTPAPTFRDVLKLINEDLLPVRMKCVKIMENEIMRLQLLDKDRKQGIGLQNYLSNQLKISSMEELKNKLKDRQREEEEEDNAVVPYVWLNKEICKEWYDKHYLVFFAEQKLGHRINHSIFSPAHDLNFIAVIDKIFEMLGFTRELIEIELKDAFLRGGPEKFISLSPLFLCQN